MVVEDLKLEAMKGSLGVPQRNLQTRWKPTALAWLRLNVDGSVDQRGEATWGGLIRNDSGNGIGGFMRKLGF